MTGAQPVTVYGTAVMPGQRVRVDIPVAEPYGHGSFSLPVVVVNGPQPGPCLFVSAAIHGDEINGVEIIRRVLAMRLHRRLRGSLIAVPVVNVYGLLGRTRYLPDRRDLNRCFPGSRSGSLAARLAHVFMNEVAKQATHGIDLHTASFHRTNLPQVRACLDDPETAALARSFGVPVIVNANVRDGSLRQAVLEKGIPMLLYEGGEALRFDEVSIRAGVRGVIEVMRRLGMLRQVKHGSSRVRPVVARSSYWVRAHTSGLLRSTTPLGARVAAGDTLGLIADVAGDGETTVCAHRTGIVIGRTNLPLVNEGDALFHIACVGRTRAARRGIEALRAELDPDIPSPSGEPTVY